MPQVDNQNKTEECEFQKVRSGLRLKRTSTIKPERRRSLHLQMRMSWSERYAGGEEFAAVLSTPF